MSSERAGVHTSRTLNREKAEAVLQKYNTDPQYRADLLDALEACVVPDPRLGRIEAVLRDYAGMNHMIADNVRAIMRGDQ